MKTWWSLSGRPSTYRSAEGQAAPAPKDAAASALALRQDLPDLGHALGLHAASSVAACTVRLLLLLLLPAGVGEEALWTWFCKDCQGKSIGIASRNDASTLAWEACIHCQKCTVATRFKLPHCQ